MELGWLRLHLVSDHSRHEVAQRAGLDVHYVERLVELNLLRPASEDAFSTGDVRRARWIHSLELAGVPLEGMATAVRKGALSFAFLDVAAFDRFAGHTGTTFRQLSDSTGIPITLLMTVREALGYSEPGAEDFVREDELSVVSAIELQLSKGFRPTVIERWLRVYADCFRRVAETEADWYRTEVVLPLLEGGMTEGEMLDIQADFGSQMAPLVEQALLAIYHGQQEHAWTKGAIQDVEGALEKAGLYSRFHGSPAVAFLDLTGYTRLTDQRGDETAAELAGELRALVRRSSLEYGGEAVKWLGDGVMLFFPQPSQSVLAALDMVDGAAAHSLPPARVGIHAGPVVFQEGDYFGRTVNIAARIADHARPGEVLVSQAVVDSDTRTALGFDEVGPAELKGVTGPIYLFAAHRHGVASGQPDSDE